jgi:hypothetical protein
MLWRYLEDGKVVEIVDLLTGENFMMEQEKTRQLQEHSRHVHEQERSKQVCEQEKTKQMQIELEMMRLRVSMKSSTSCKFRYTDAMVTQAITAVMVTHAIM